MILGCSQEAFHNLSDETFIKVVSRVGLNHVELVANATESRPDRDQRLANLQRLLEQHQILASSLVLDFGNGASSEFIQTVFQGLNAGEQLRVSHVVLRRNAMGKTECPSVLDRRDEWLRCGDQAGKLGLILALETEPGACVNSKEAARILHALNHEAIKWNFDTGAYLLHNPNASGETALQRLPEKIAAVRLTDYQETASEGVFPALGQGAAVDFALTHLLLRTMDFSGPCAISFSPPLKQAGDRAALALESLEKSLAELRACGWLDR